MEFHNAIAMATRQIFTNPELLAEGEAAMVDRARDCLAHRCAQVKNHAKAECVDMSTSHASVQTYKVLKQASVVTAVYREGQPCMYVCSPQASQSETDGHTFIDAVRKGCVSVNGEMIYQSGAQGE